MTKSKQTKAKKATAQKKRKGVHWTKTEIATMLDLLEKGITVDEISIKLQRSRKSIENKIYRERRQGTIIVDIEAAMKEPVEEIAEELKFESKWQKFFNWVLRTGK